MISCECWFTHLEDDPCVFAVVTTCFCRSLQDARAGDLTERCREQSSLFLSLRLLECECEMNGMFVSRSKEAEVDGLRSVSEREEQGRFSA